MKRLLTIAGIGASLLVPTAALAAGNSTPGIDRYNDNPWATHFFEKRL